MKISKHRYYRPLGTLQPGEFAFISHEAIKISVSGEIYVDLMAILYTDQTDFQIYMGDDYGIGVVDYSQYVWAVTDIEDPRYVKVQEYMEAHDGT